MTRIALVTFGLSLSSVTFAGGTLTTVPTGSTPLPGIPLCDPAKDPNCLGIVSTQPGDGHIVPDPTLSLAECEKFWDPEQLFNAPLAVATYNPERTTDVRVWVQTSWDENFMYYTAVMLNADPGEQVDLGVTMSDLDGDGALDLIVGVPHASDITDDAGKLAVFFGPIGERLLDLREPDLTIYGTVRGGELGLGVGRMAGGEKGPDGLRINAPYEGYHYEIPATGEIPEKLDKSYLVRERTSTR